jgi:serine/threonine-protein kinase
MSETPEESTNPGLDDPITEESLVGRLLDGRYELRELIATGAMGAVYRAHQRGMGRWVALKVLHEDLDAEDAVVKRFYREMQATARIEHPNTVRIYDFGHAEDGALFLVMELLTGRTLADVMVDEGPLTAARTARIGAQIAGALAAARREGVVHRDLKPENIFLSAEYGPSDWVKVFDFGLAQLEGTHPVDKTEGGARVGTPLYMAPEYIQNRVADYHADLYALGVLLYEMVVGKPPFTGNPQEVMDKHVRQPPPRAADNASQYCPIWMDKLIARLLRKDPAGRPHDPARVARILERGAVREAAIEAGHVHPVAPRAEGFPVVWLVLALVVPLFALGCGGAALAALGVMGAWLAVG